MSLSSAPLLAITGFITIAIGFVPLLYGYLSTKNNEYRKHRNLMVIAVIVLLLFLLQYIVRAVFLGQETHFEGPSWVRSFIYLPILVVHISFAIVTIALITFHLTKSLRNQEETPSNQIIFPKEYRSKHRKLGKITFILWIFSYLGGIVIFIMLYLLDFEGQISV